MLPVDLTPRKLALPRREPRTIVIFTGPELRHIRFALRLQQEFGDLVVAWFQVLRAPLEPVSGGSRARRIFHRIKAAAFEPATFPFSRIRPMSQPSQRQVEERLFGAEVEALRVFARMEPAIVGDPNTEAVVEAVKALDPYFILTLGGAIYKTALLQCAQGLALNQHDGWCPAYRGSATVDWALYHRDLAHIGSTVHILTTGMDAGPILRRSRACLVEDDSRASCFARTVALGTELVCEVVAEALHADEINVYDQPEEMGYTYRLANLTREIQQSIERDLQSGLIARELARARIF